MVVPSLAIGGAVGVLLSGGFVWWEIGRYATPSVPVTLFDERKLLTAYTVGLFVGVPLAVVYLLFVFAFANGALLGGLVFLGGVVLGGELAQRLLMRTGYWRSPAVPFYTVALRSGIGAILSLTVVSGYLGAPSIDWELAAPTALTTLAVLALQIAVGIVGTPSPASPAARGGMGTALLLGFVGFFLIGFGPLAGAPGVALGSGIALAGSVIVFRRRRSVLAEVPAPGGAPASEEAPLPSAYGRTEPPPPPAA